MVKLATQVLNFFQTSRKTLYLCSLLALVLALSIFSGWRQVFTEHNFPVQVKLSAPKAEYVRIYYNNPKKQPAAYERVPLNLLPSGTWQVEVKALSEKSPQSKAMQVWLLDLSTPQSRVDWSKAEFQGQQWEFSNNPNAPQGKVAFTQGNQLQGLKAQLTGSQLTIKLLHHPWSGKAKVTVNGSSQIVDLFSETSHAETLAFQPTLPGGELARSYEVNLPNTDWNKLRIVAEGEHSIKVEEVTAFGQALQKKGDRDFILPFAPWKVLTSAIASTVISFLWMTMLFVSAVHLWQRRSQQRFGRWTYAIGLSVALAGFWLLTFYPGLMTLDSLVDWDNARTLNQHSDRLIDAWFPPFISILMRGSFAVSGEYGLFTFFQLFLFYLSIILLLTELCSSRFALIVLPIVLLNPAIWNQGILVTKDVWTTTALVTLAYSIISFRSNSETLTKKVCLLSVFTASCIGFFLFRYNSIITLPAIIFSIWIGVRSLKWRMAFIMGCLLACLTTVIPMEWYGFQKVDTAAASIIWEHVGILKQVGRPEVTQKYNLDFIGDTQKAIEKHNYIDHGSLFWESGSPFQLDVVLRQGSQIKRSFQELVSEYPTAFLINKMYIYKTLLGINNVVPLYITDESIYGVETSTYKRFAEPYQLIYRPKLPEIAKRVMFLLFEKFSSPFPVFTPWTTLLGSILLCLCLLWQKLISRDIVILLSLSLCYYSGYFLLTPGLHFRYFLPTYVILLMMCFRGIERIAGSVVKRSFPSD